MIVPKKTGIFLVIAGAVLLLSALLLFLYNRYEDAQAGLESESLLRDVQSAIEDRRTPPAAEETPASSDSKMPAVMLEGYEYIGYLTIPSLDLQLPVMAQWDDFRLKLAPCRHFGSSRTDDLVIAAHNYKSHFGSLKDMQPGDTVQFTDIEGVVNNYVLEVLETLDPTEVQAVKDSGYDLVLYTCTTDGSTRVVAFFNRPNEAELPAESGIPE